MHYLKNSRLLFLFLSAFTTVLSGCTTSSFYKISKQEGRKYELSISPDRIQLECEKLENGFYGFMIHILDDEKTVLTSIQSNSLGRKSCQFWDSSISKIIKNGSKIYLAGIGDLGAPRVQEKYTYQLSNKGRFFSNGRILHFMFIANEHGSCFGAYTTDSKPCPRDEFPIK